MDNLIVLYTLLIIGVATGSYVYGTKFRKIINIKRKFTTLRGDKHGIWSVRMVSDMSDNVYQMSDCIWYLHFGSLTSWVNIEKKQAYEITGYGVEIPILGIYPNILSAKCAAGR